MITLYRTAPVKSYNACTNRGRMLPASFPLSLLLPYSER